MHAYEFPGKKEGTTVPMDPTLDPGWELTAFCFVRRLTSGGQAECGGVRVGDKITAICGTAVITDAEVAVEWAKAKFPVDSRRIYLTGTSGGGHMTLLMAAKYPEIWAAASAWAPASPI